MKGDHNLRKVTLAFKSSMSLLRSSSISLALKVAIAALVPIALMRERERERETKQIGNGDKAQHI